MVSTANAEQHRTLLLQAHGLLCMAWRVASVAGGCSPLLGLRLKVRLIVRTTLKI